MQLYHLYVITIFSNNKKYTGQTIDPVTRWRQHIYESRKEKPSMIINRAMKKHCFTDGHFDPTKCSFEVIACCLTQDNANALEELLIVQENTHIKNKMGYNVSLGGNNAPKTDAWRKQLSDWHASLTPKEKATRRQRQSEVMLNLIATKGHPAQGTKRTPEQLENLSRARKEHPVEYTIELRQKMSNSHKGKTQSEELIQKRVISIKLTCEERTNQLIEAGELKCHAPECKVQGKYKPNYRWIDGLRYCVKHYNRFQKFGTFDKPAPHNKGKLMPEEHRQKLLGRPPHNKGKGMPPISEETRLKLKQHNPPNKTFIEDEKVIAILSNTTLSINKLAKELQVTRRIIDRIKVEYRTIEEYKADREKSEAQKRKREQIVPLYQSGMSQQDIVKHLHIDNRAVNQILREHFDIT